MLRNFRILLSFDGTRYRGWQRLRDDENTIQAKLESVVTRMIGTQTEVVGSGRTDAGVHATGQVANFRADTAMTPAEILAYLRRYLPEDIGVLSVEEAPVRFHSRLNAVKKTYTYRIWNSDSPCVFERRYVWRMAEPLDLAAMREAAALLTGTHDFRAFCANKHFKRSAVRTVGTISIARHGDELRLQFTGDGFLYHMVRILVGTLVEVGEGKRTAASVADVLASRDREQAGFTAPACGLCLTEVCYE